MTVVWLATLALVPATAVSIVAGLGLGLITASLGARAYALPTATALTAGLLLAGMLDGICYLTGGEPLTLAAAVATALVVASVAWSSWHRPPDHRAATGRKGS